jgi:AraC-like DNA-binding protein
MEFQHFLPSTILQPYVKNYWIFTTDKDISNQVLYPTGFLELAINISGGDVITHVGNRSIKMPDLEVLGQLTMPTKVTATKDTTILITRFYPYASSVFFPDQVSSFTNDSIDLHDILRGEVNEFYDRIMEQRLLEQKISVIEAFLIRRLIKNKKSRHHLKLVECICNHSYQNGESFNIEKLASLYGFSKRHVQRLFLDLVGITPQRFFSVQRFNKGLELIQSSNTSLTSIALECGYYDQAHFIKEFKSYTGLTPSQVTRILE